MSVYTGKSWVKYLDDSEYMGVVERGLNRRVCIQVSLVCCM